jgi:hypothetical protein
MSPAELYNLFAGFDRARVRGRARTQSFARSIPHTILEGRDR